MLRAYNDNVPDKMTEKEFWEKFFQSAYFHRDRVRESTINVAKEDIFAGCLEEEVYVRVCMCMRACICVCARVCACRITSEILAKYCY